MFDDNMARDILAKMQEAQVEIVGGLSEPELENIEKLLGAKLPPDLRILLAAGVPVAYKGNAAVFPQWHQNPETEIVDMRKAVENAFTSDIENNNYWTPSFGEKPEDLEQAKAQALEVIRSWPPLVRIYGHRYMPTEPHDSGNPVLSVWQATDTVYYGANLVDYLAKEFGIKLSTPADNPRDVPFWGEAFKLN